MKPSKSIHQSLPQITLEVEQQIHEDQKQCLEDFENKLKELRELVLQLSVKENDFSKFEQTIQSTLMSVGLEACELFLASNRQPPPSLKIFDEQGRTYKYQGEKSYPVRSIFGQGSFVSSQYLRGEHYKAHREIAILEGQVGLFPMGGLSPNIVLQTAELSTRMPYEHVREVLGRFYDYVPSKRSICGLIDLMGPHAQGELEKLEISCAEIVIVQFDGRGLPYIRPEELEKRCKPHKKTSGKSKRRRQKNRCEIRPRRTKGKKAKTKKQVTVGLIYTLKRHEDGTWEGPVSKVYVAQFGNAEAVFQRVSLLLSKIPGVKEVIFISDGALHYEKLRKKYFPDAIGVIDFFHVSEYLWKAGETLYKEGSKELTRFVRKLKALLLKGQAEKVVEMLREKEKELAKKGPGSKGKRKRMKASIGYISKRLELMPYKRLREKGLEIGSGAIESAMRQVVAIRFDGPGMRWGLKRPQMLLNLLCLRLSGGWSKLEERMKQWAHQYHEKSRMTPVGVNEKKKKQIQTNPLKEEEKLPMVANW